jgi:hypothetical protein
MCILTITVVYRVFGAWESDTNKVRESSESIKKRCLEQKKNWPKMIWLDRPRSGQVTVVNNPLFTWSWLALPFGWLPISTCHFSL